jgi:hypothetical protein
LSKATSPRLCIGSIAIAVDDRSIARQFELHGNTERLVTAISE